MTRKILLILIAFVVCLSCATEKTITDKAAAASWTGTVKIISTGKPGESCSGEKDYIDVRFDFTPDDADAVNGYLVKESPDKNILLYYDNRFDLHKNWIEKWGLKTGNVYRAVRRENTQNSPGKRAAFEVFLEPR